MVQQGRVVPIEVFYSKTVYVTSGEKRNLDILYCSVGQLWLFTFCPMHG